MYQDGGNFAEGYMVGRDSNNYGNNGFFGADGAWWIIILLLFGWGNGFGNGGANNMAGYEIGRLATTNDVASGFSTSTIMSTQRDSQLAMQQGFSDIQQTLCQGFGGINTTVLQTGNAIQSQLASCCCDLRSLGLENRYLNERQTCNLITNANANTQRIIDYLTGEKISSLQAENAALTAQLSQNSQTNTIINSIMPRSVPAYVTCSPYQSIFGLGTTNSCGY